MTDVPALVAFAVAFVGSVTAWWLYFDTTGRAGIEAITHSDDPGRMGAAFHYVHVLLIGAIIVVAVGNELSIAHPDHRPELAPALVLVGGPVLYLLGNGVYKTIVWGWFPLSHMVGLAALVVLWVPAFGTDQLMVAGLTTLVLVTVAVWERRSRLSGGRGAGRRGAERA